MAWCEGSVEKFRFLTEFIQLLTVVAIAQLGGSLTWIDYCDASDVNQELKCVI